MYTAIPTKSIVPNLLSTRINIIHDNYYSQCEEDNIDDEITFVRKNIEVANSVIESGLRYVDEKGNVIIKEQLNTGYMQQEEALITSFRMNIFKGAFIDSGPLGSAIAGTIGILANIRSYYLGIGGLMDLSTAVNSQKYMLTKGLKVNTTSEFTKVLGPQIGGGIIGIISQTISNFNLDLNVILSGILVILSIVSLVLTCTVTAKWIISLFLTLICVYVPNIVMGVQMIYRKTKGQGSHANIG